MRATPTPSSRPEQATAPLEGAPPAARRDPRPGERAARRRHRGLRARLAELEGTPVVVNKWASWCGPCRLEFPFFQSQAEQRGAEVAFLGVLSNDSEDAGATFLEELPLPYPSYLDPDQDIAAEIEAPQNFPATAFYDSQGRARLHPPGRLRGRGRRSRPTSTATRASRGEPMADNGTDGSRSHHRRDRRRCCCSRSCCCPPAACWRLIGAAGLVAAGHHRARATTATPPTTSARG